MSASRSSIYPSTLSRIFGPVIFVTLAVFPFGLADLWLCVTRDGISRYAAHVDSHEVSRNSKPTSVDKSTDLETNHSCLLSSAVLFTTFSLRSFPAVPFHQK